jgi:hypothetical protein
MSSPVIALQLGVRFKPPTLVLQYTVAANGVTRQRSMPIRGLSKSSDCYDEAERMKNRHEMYLGGLPTVRIEKFIRYLIFIVKFFIL